MTYLETIDIADIVRKVRRAYLALEKSGVTHVRMAKATGLPKSTFSMVLRARRPIVKVSTLDALIKGLRKLQDPLE